MIPPIILSALTNKYVIGILLIISIGGYVKYQSSQIEALKKDVQISEANNKSLEDGLKDAAEVMSILRDDYNRQRFLRLEQIKLVQHLRDTNKELRKKLYREQQGKKSIEELAIAKPGLIKKIINNGTQKVLDCFEGISEGKEKCTNK